MPRHLSVIMDGNSRWAAARGVPTDRGHAAGVEALRQLITDCISLPDVQELSVYAFSQENWSRPRTEVNALLGLIERVLVAEADTLLAHGVRLRFVGELTQLPAALQRLLERLAARAPPPGAQTLLLCVALSYGGRQELARAAREIATRAVEGELSLSAIDESTLAEALHSSPQNAPSDPDMLLRTGGQFRLSNFMLFQCAYTELVVTDVLWPDFGTADLAAALREFGRRHRTFGQRHVHDEPSGHAEGNG
jgi:undecaprenyl diphosphate synthase